MIDILQVESDMITRGLGKIRRQVGHKFNSINILKKYFIHNNCYLKIPSLGHPIGQNT